MIVQYKYLTPSETYETYPCIVKKALLYEKMPYYFKTVNIQGFYHYLSEDKTRVLLMYNLSREKFNYLEFIINVKDNSLIWCGHRRVGNNMWITREYYSINNIFICEETNVDFDYIKYILVGIAKYSFETSLRPIDRCNASYIKFEWLRYKLLKLIN